jgi:hypothetical protein
MNRHLLVLALLTALVGTSGFAPAAAGTPIDQTRPLDARGRVDIDNLKGRIQVRAWNRNEVHVSGTLGAGVEKLVVEGDAQHLVVRAQYPKHMGAWRSDRTEPTTLVLQVPLQADLDIQSVSADIDVDGVAPGELELDTVSGQVVVAGAPGSAELNSVSGDMRLTLNSSDVKVDSVSGDVVLNGRLDGQVHGETVSGRLVVDSRGKPVQRLSMATVSGDAQARLVLAPRGEIKAETVSGDIQLVLPRSLSAQVSGESFSGDLSAPDAKIRKEEFGPGSSFHQRYGDGAGEVHIETFSGDATLVLQ